jgi:outer membrane protein
MQDKLTRLMSLGALIVSVVALGFGIFAFTKGVKVPKIGIVDNALIMSQFSEAIDARQKFEKEKSVWENNTKVLEDSLRSNAQFLSQNYAKASKEKKIELEKKMERLNNEYNRYGNAVKQMKSQKEIELLKPVVEKANSFLATWAKQKGYDIILGTGNGGVILSADQKWNITPVAIAEMNHLYEGKKVDLKTDALSSNNNSMPANSKNQDSGDSAKKTNPSMGKK